MRLQGAFIIFIRLMKESWNLVTEVPAFLKKSVLCFWGFPIVRGRLLCTDRNGVQIVTFYEGVIQEVHLLMFLYYM
jgi:hypothetical protein